MNKKIISMLALLTCALTLGSCGNNKDNSDSDVTPPTPVEPIEKKGTVKFNKFENGEIRADKDSGKVGDKINLTILPSKNYEIDFIKVNNANLEISNNKASFLLVEGENIIDAHFKEIIPPAPIIKTGTITIAKSDHGTITANKTSGNVDEEITLTVKADEGFELEFLKANDVTLEVTENTAKFKLKEGTNTIVSKFKEIIPPAPIIKTGTVKIGSYEHGTITANKTSGNVGDEIILTITPDTNYELEFIKLGDNSLEVIDKKASFKLLEGENIINAKFKEIIPPAPIIKTGTVKISLCENGSVKANKTSGNVGDEIILTITPNKFYAIDYVTLNNKKIVVKDNISTFKLLEGDNIIYASFKKVVEPLIKNGTVVINESEGGTVKANKLSGKVGDIITLTVNVLDNYKLDKIFANNKELNMINGEASFTLEEGENTVKATFTKIEIPEAKTGNVIIVQSNLGYVSSSKTKGNVGDEIILNIFPNDGYEVDFLKLNNSNLLISNNKATFNLLEGENKITVSFKEVENNESVQKQGTVVIENCENGSVVASKTSGNVGETINLTIVPNQNYQIDTLRVGNKYITVSQNKASFELEEGENIIYASFKEISLENKATVIIKDTQNGSIIANKTVGNAGDEIILNIKSEQNFELETLKINGTIVVPQDNKYTFNLIKGENLIEAVFSKKAATISLLPCENGSVEISKLNGTFGEKIDLIINPNYGYEIDVLTLNDKPLLVKDNKASFVIDSKENFIKCTFKEIKNTVIIEESSNGKVTVDKTSGNVEEIITISVFPNAGYELYSLVINGNEIITNENSAKFQLKFGENTIKANFIKKKSTVSIENTKYGKVEADKLEGEIGETVNLTINANKGYELQTLLINGEVKEVIGNTISFTLIEGINTIKATFIKNESIEFQKIGNVIIEENKDCTIQASKLKGLANEEITITVSNIKTGYKLHEIYMNGTLLTITDENKATFKLLEGDNIITVYLTEIEKEPVTTGEIKIIETPNGTVKIDKITGEIGDVATLTITPNNGYTIDQVIVNQNSLAFFEVNGAYQSSFFIESGINSVMVTFKLPSEESGPKYTEADYKYANTKNKEIAITDLFSKKGFQYLVFVYDENNQDCKELETNICKLIMEYQNLYSTEAFLVNSSTIDEQYKTTNLNEAKGVEGATDLTTFKCYGAPTMYIIQEQEDGTKYINLVCVGSADIKVAFKMMGITI